MKQTGNQTAVNAREAQEAYEQYKVDAKPQIWIVGCRDMDGIEPWEFVGAYDSKEKAFAECKDCRFFAAKVGLNDTAPEKSSPWPEHHQPSNEWPAHYTPEMIADWERRNPE